jgi:hypothetical protein
MYEFHMWLLLRESTTEVDEGSLLAKLTDLRTLLVAKLPDAVPASPIFSLNYEHLLQCSVAHNHRGDTHVRLLAVLSSVAQNLPGSYGLVYWHDDEVPGGGNGDAYRVLVVARGAIMDRSDPFLSPISPTVED